MYLWCGGRGRNALMVGDTAGREFGELWLRRENLLCIWLRREVMEANNPNKGNIQYPLVN